MKLQMNCKGSWRDVVEFDAVYERAIKEAVIPLAQAMSAANSTGVVPSWRLTSNSRTALAYCDAPKFKWRRA